MTEIRDDGKTNPILIISDEELIEFIKAKVYSAGYDARQIAAVQISVKQPFGAGLLYHYEVPQLVVMVSHGSKREVKVMTTLEQLQSLPQWRSHKIVRAAKIVGVQPGNPRNTLLLQDVGEIEVDEAYMMKHQPQVGGYFVVYNDGYASFSPAKAFEEGYTRV